MPRRKHEGPARSHTTLQISEENNQWLDEVKEATGESRSDITNRAIEALRDEGRIKQLVKEALTEAGIGRGTPDHHPQGQDA